MLYVDRPRILSTGITTYNNFHVTQCHEEICFPVAHALEHAMATAMIHNNVAAGILSFREAYDQAVSIGPHPLRVANPEAAATMASALSIM